MVQPSTYTVNGDVHTPLCVGGRNKLTNVNAIIEKPISAIAVRLKPWNGLDNRFPIGIKYALILDDNEFPVIGFQNIFGGNLGKAVVSQNTPISPSRDDGTMDLSATDCPASDGDDLQGTLGYPAHLIGLGNLDR